MRERRMASMNGIKRKDREKKNSLSYVYVYVWVRSYGLSFPFFGCIKIIYISIYVNALCVRLLDGNIGSVRNFN